MIQITKKQLKSHKKNHQLDYQSNEIKYLRNSLNTRNINYERQVYNAKNIHLMHRQKNLQKLNNFVSTPQCVSYYAD